MKRYLAIVFTFFVSLSSLFVLYNYFDEKNTYEKIAKENIVLNERYLDLKNIISKYEKNLNDDESKQNDYMDALATYEKEIEIVSSDIEKILNGLIEDPVASKTAYLTFDDGPSRITLKILDVLKEYGVKGTFFVNGNDSDYSKDIYERIVDEGHSIGNHTFVHSYKKVYSSVENFAADFDKLQTLIKETTGVTMNIMRFPGGSNNTISNRYSRGIMDKLTSYYELAGYQYFDWNVSAGDSRSRRTSIRTITNNVLKGSRGKSNVIILMHDSMYKKNTAAALPKIIKSLKDKGFEILPLTTSSKNVQFK